MCGGPNQPGDPSWLQMGPAARKRGPRLRKPPPVRLNPETCPEPFDNSREAPRYHRSRRRVRRGCSLMLQDRLVDFVLKKTQTKSRPHDPRRSPGENCVRTFEIFFFLGNHEHLTRTYPNETMTNTQSSTVERPATTKVRPSRPRASSRGRRLFSSREKGSSRVDLFASWALVVVGSLWTLLGVAHSTAVSITRLDPKLKGFAHVMGMLLYYLPGFAVAGYGVQRLKKQKIKPRATHPSLR